MTKALILTPVAALLVLSCSAIRASSADELGMAPFNIGASEFPFGDSIVITEVLSTTREFTEGSVLTVRGTYELRSRDKASLYLGTTSSRKSRSRRAERDVNRLSISKGSGSFELTHTVPGPGFPHITLYDRATGAPFGGSYFGNGDTLLPDRPLGYDR